MGRRASRSDVCAAALPARIGRQGPRLRSASRFLAREGRAFLPASRQCVELERRGAKNGHPSPAWPLRGTIARRSGAHGCRARRGRRGAALSSDHAGGLRLRGRAATTMNASADNSQLICRRCGAPVRRVGNCVGRCVACLLELAFEEEQISVANAEQFDHYHVAIHTDGTPLELGRGAMGITFKAFDTVLGNEVALKVIDARIAALPEARERFLREARAAARLRHPNIASVFYYGTRKSDGQCFYAMELVEGETLETRLRRSGPLPPALALEVITQVATALVTLEAHGLVHRDLKPANLMLVHGPELTIKVIDFGLAKAAATAGSETHITTHGGFVGTPSFASPSNLMTPAWTSVQTYIRWVSRCGRC